MRNKFAAAGALSFVLSANFPAIVQAAEVPSEDTVSPAAHPDAAGATQSGGKPVARSGPGKADGQDNRLLKEMVVSAAKDKPVQQRTELGKVTVYTPVSGAVVSQEEIEHLQIVNPLLELGKRVPGISMVRNMRIPDGGKDYTESRQDGMRTLARNTSALDAIDLSSVERVDVITGPASALYGTGALGGTISVTSRKPPQEFGARLSQEAGSWGFRRTQGDVGVSSADGRYGFLITGSTMNYDGWRASSTIADGNAAAEKKTGAGVKAFFNPTETTRISAGYDYLMYDYRWAGYLAMTKFKQDWRQTTAGTYGESIDYYGTKTLRLQQMVGDRGELTLAYGRIDDDSTAYGGAGSGGASNVICDDSSTGAALATGTTVKCSSVNGGTYNATTKKWTGGTAVTNTLKYGTNTATTTTAQYRHEFDAMQSTLYVGTDIYETIADTATYSNAYTASQAQSGLWARGAMTATGQGSVTTRRENTPYVHYEFSPAEKWRIHMGERFATVNDTVDDRTAANKDVQMSHRGNVLRSGVTYEFTADHLVWGNVAQTFNPPATTTLVNSAAVGTAGNTIGANLAPEKALTTEIGFRGRFDASAFQYDVTLYNTVNDGFNVTRVCTAAEAAALNNGATCNINENAGQLTARGLETMFSWAVNSWFDVGATYTNARAYYNTYKTATVNYSGNSYQAMPNQRLNVRASFKPAANWQVELEGDHISDYYVDTANSGTYTRPDLYNLRASYRQKKDLSLWLHVLNLTNQEYATRVGYSTIAGISTLAASAGQGNSGSYIPLTLRIGASYKF